MEELVGIMEEIRDLLISIDTKLDGLCGNGFQSIDDVCDKLDKVRGYGQNSLTDVCEKLDNLRRIV